MSENYTYLNWDGYACRVLNYYDLTKAEIEVFRPGVGFTDAPFGAAYKDGFIISEKEFKELITKSIINSKRQG